MATFTSTPPSAVTELSLTRLHLMRAGYLLNTVALVASSRLPSTALGSATNASQSSFQVDSNSNTGSSLTG